APPMSKARLCSLCCLLFLLLPCVLSAAPPAAKADLVESRRHDLEEQQSVVARLQAEVDKKRGDLQKLRDQDDASPTTINAAMVEEARVEKEGAEIELQSIGLDTLASQNHQNDLTAAVEQLHRKIKEMRGSKSPAVEQQLAEKQSLLELESVQQNLLDQRTQLIKEKLQLAKDYWSLLSERYEIVQSSQREEALADLEKHLKQETDRLQSLSAQLNERLSEIESNRPEAEVDKSLLQTQIKEAEESSYLLKMQLQAEKSAYTLKQLDTALRDKELETARLAAIVAEADQIHEELQAAVGLTQSKAAILQQTLEVKQKRQPTGAAAQQKLRREQQIIANLIDQFGRQLGALQRVTEQAGKVSEAAHQAHLENVKKGLTARHQLPSELFEWKALAQEILSMPQTLAEGVLRAAGQYWGAFVQASPSLWAELLGLEALWLLLWRQMARLPPLQAIAQSRRSASFSETAVDVAWRCCATTAGACCFADSFCWPAGPSKWNSAPCCCWA
ncbi:hypothetical protein, partial [Methylogaea oryzae]|uniref:hypothetical protein n=1 Tax=Methylogaea oryzae TaxID=1295382 RepID=UPI001C3F2617